MRGFARHLSGVDTRTEIPPPGLVTTRARRRGPHLFSDEDVSLVARLARASTPSPFRAETLATLIGLLAATGMRVGEALRLDRGEVDWKDAVILVRDSKFHKGRNIPVSASTIEALAAYSARHDRPKASATRLFVSLAGTPVIYANFFKTFHGAVVTSGIGEPSGAQPADT